MKPQTWTIDRLINTALYLGGILLFLWALDYLSPYLASFFIALLSAYLLEPIVRFIQTRMKVKRRWLAVGITLISIMGFLLLIAIIVLPSMAGEFMKLEKILEESLTAIEVEELIPEGLIAQIEAFFYSEDLKKLLNRGDLAGYGAAVIGYIGKALSGAAGVLMSLFSLVTFFLYLVFIMLFYHDFADHWEEAIPPAYRNPLVMLIHDVEDGMQVYFRGQALVVFWVCILFAIGFELINLPLGILLGIFVGLLNFVPYLQMLGLIPAFALAAVQSAETGQSFWVVLGLVVLVFTVVQGIQEIVLIPRILGEATGLNPAIILLSLSIWGGLFGIIGMVIALPMTSLLINYYRRFILGHEIGAIGEEE
jgi:predicted PurR-regulated permease PerM